MPQRRRAWFALFAVAGVACLVALGVWQLQRRAWKAGLIARIEGQLAQNPVALPADVDPVRWDYRRIVAPGQAVEGPLQVWTSRTLQGRVGVHLLGFLLLDDGRALLVDRGWVPVGPGLAPMLDSVAPWSGDVAVTGALRLPSRPGAFTPDNDASSGRWSTLDPGAMAAAAGLDGHPVVPLVLQLDDSDPAAPPFGQPVVPDLPDNHLQYALTWFALAAGLAAIAVVFVRRPSNEDAHDAE